MRHLLQQERQEGVVGHGELGGAAALQLVLQQ
jgi:hypothetical protein